MSVLRPFRARSTAEHGAVGAEARLYANDPGEIGITRLLRSDVRLLYVSGAVTLSGLIFRFMSLVAGRAA